MTCFLYVHVKHFDLRYFSMSFVFNLWSGQFLEDAGFVVEPDAPIGRGILCLIVNVDKRLRDHIKYLNRVSEILYKVYLLLYSPSEKIIKKQR